MKTTHFPLMLALVCTVHKAQGVTLDKKAISSELLRHRSFIYGQISVAMSRVNSFNGVHLIGKINLSVIREDTRNIYEY